MMIAIFSLLHSSHTRRPFKQAVLPEMMHPSYLSLNIIYNWDISWNENSEMIQGWLS